MRTHKPPKGSYISHLTENKYLPLMSDFLNGRPEVKVFDLKRHHNQMVELMKLKIARERGIDPSTIRITSNDQYCDTEDNCPLDFYANLKYLYERPTDISLDRSIRDHIEASPQTDEITIPDLEKGVVWIDQHKMGLKADINLGGERPLYKKVKGVLLIQADDFMRKAMPVMNSVVSAYQKKFGGLLPPYIAQVHAEDGYFYIFPLSKKVSFEELYNGEARDRTPLQDKSYSYALILALLALQKIEGGEFIRDSSKYVERGLPLNKRPKNLSKRGKFKQKYREFRTTRYRHVDSEPNPNETRTYTPPEHYTPRNVRSHYRERWVTIDYVEKHQVENDDIIDIEDRTRMYKRGKATKSWVKIKLWHEFPQDPNLEPTQEIERYRA